MINRNPKRNPLFAITMGDPAGIGPEIALKALSNNRIPLNCKTFIIGDISIIKAVQTYTHTSCGLHVMQSVQDYKKKHINVYDISSIGPSDYMIGTANKECGIAAYSYIEQAITFAKESQIDGVITNPINKEALKLANIQFPGHTEMFARKTGTSDFSMLLKLDHVYTAHVTTHCSLKEAIEAINIHNVFTTIKLLDHTLKMDFGISHPVIGVGGLNPHAGEGGLFGNEEMLHIIPAIKKAQALKINVKGPLPPDTVFMRAFNREFQGIVSMIHDHGFTALKTRNFSKCVNITIGLPIIRTSVGHGTAFDIAGTGQASEQNLIESILTAYEIYLNR